MTKEKESKPQIEWYEPILDKGILPDFLLRQAISNILLRTRAADYSKTPFIERHKQKLALIKKWAEREKIAEGVKEANEQHYEVPQEFLACCLGENLKYSCCLYDESKSVERDTLSLAEAEKRMLELYSERADLRESQSILDLGCGWGSLCLFLAKKYPHSKITALSNSRTQREFIEKSAKERGIFNLSVITADVQVFDTNERFDRILSIEMLEHMKNYRELFRKINSWLRPEGKFFCHVFCHWDMCYDYDVNDRHSWMARNFFTGGTMPSSDLFLYFQENLTLIDSWMVNGVHYSKTSEHWLQNLDKNRSKAIEILRKHYLITPTESTPNASPETPASESEADELAKVWFQRWRIFYISVAEFFKFGGGDEWLVGHYLFKKGAQ